MLALGMLGLPRRVATYPANEGLNALNLTAPIGAFILGSSLLFFIYNLYISNYRKVPAPPDPWQGTTLEWATSSPPPRFNFTAEYPVPRIRSYAPLLDIRERASQAGRRRGGRGQPGQGGAGEEAP
jgi:cytochrome c oxidase subunit 1